MKEYTLLAVFSVLAVIFIDIVVLKTKLFFDKRFWVFWSIMFVIIFIINGYLTWRPIVTYGNVFFQQFRIFTIPIEDFLYGFSLITFNITIWEYYAKKRSLSRSSE